MIFEMINGQNYHLRFYFGLYIKQRRQALRLSLESLASQLHISDREYRNIEAGKTPISVDLYENLFQILSLDNEELYEIQKISTIAYGNTAIKELSENYPK